MAEGGSSSGAALTAVGRRRREARRRRRARHLVADPAHRGRGDDTSRLSARGAERIAAVRALWFKLPAMRAPWLPCALPGCRARSLVAVRAP
eukprot:6400831-Prymnesium_polylepis.1